MCLKLTAETQRRGLTEGGQPVSHEEGMTGFSGMHGTCVTTDGKWWPQRDDTVARKVSIFKEPGKLHKGK